MNPYESPEAKPGKPRRQAPVKAICWLMVGLMFGAAMLWTGIYTNDSVALPMAILYWVGTLVSLAMMTYWELSEPPE